MCENHLLERTWCPKCAGRGFHAIDAFTDIKCHVCQATGRVWSQDARAWVARQQSVKEEVASDQ